MLLFGQIIMKYSDVSSRIAWALNQIPETIEEMAEKLGINKNTVASYKKGKADVKFSVVVGLHELYGFKPHWLITGKGNPLIPAEKFVEEREFVEESAVSKTNKSPKGKNISSIDLDLLIDIVKAVEITIADHIENISVEKKAEAISLLYSYFIDTGAEVDEKIVLRFLKLGER